VSDNGSNKKENGTRRSGRPLNEEDVLAVIEQGADPSDTIGASRDARLASRVQAMRADREALSSFADVQAPPDLLRAAMDEALAIDERALLIGLAETEAGAGGIRRGSTIPLRDRLMDRVMDRPVRWLVSAAASLLLLLGSGAFIIARTIDGKATADAGSLVASAESNTNPNPNPDPKTEVLPKASPTSPDSVIAQRTDNEAPDRDPAPAVGEGEAVLAGADAREPAESGLSPSVDWHGGHVASLAEAASLLAERKLAVQVFHLRSGDAQQAMTAAIDVGNASGTWSLSDAPMAGSASSVRTMRAVLDQAVPLPTPLVFADANTEGDPARTPAGPKHVRLGVWTMTLVPKATAIAAAKAALERQGLSVRLVRLDAPLAEPIDARPEAIAWWNLPPSRWPSSVAVPVLVDAGE
jgi:hypothetical protein